MACGTPVIAWRRGSAPEVIDHGVTGFLVDGIDEAADAVERVRGLDRERVRRRFESRFSIERVARDYVRVFKFLAAEPAELDRVVRLDAEPVRRLAANERAGRGLAPRAARGERVTI